MKEWIIHTICICGGVIANTLAIIWFNVDSYLGALKEHPIETIVSVVVLLLFFGLTGWLLGGRYARIKGEEGLKKLGEIEQETVDANKELEKKKEERDRLCGEIERDRITAASLAAQIGSCQADLDRLRAEREALNKDLSCEPSINSIDFALLYSLSSDESDLHCAPPQKESITEPSS